jgi:5-methylcytosine-specific restriction endonuclease McrA
MNYKDQIKNPLWQKKRLEILNRDSFTCQYCGDTEEQLQVHHTYYSFNKNIWEYENESLITLCSNCHGEISDLKRIIKSRVDNQFVYSDTLNELEGIIEVLAELNPYDLQELRISLIKKYMK